MKFKYVLSFLVLAAAAVWLAVLGRPSQDELHLVVCDVGQGDAILIFKGDTQIIVDGGPGKRILECLSKYIPYYDREIELVVLTHPQSDHYSGLIEVFKDYSVDSFLASEIDNSTQGYEVLKKVVGGTGVKVVNPTEGQNVSIGLISLDILNGWQDDQNSENVLGATSTKKDLNDYSIVFNLSFGEFDALFTGDIGPKISQELVKQGVIRDIDYLKIPHHGSKNGMTEEFLAASNPEMAVMSLGANNRFGHPHKEILDMLSNKNLKTFRTDLMGDIHIATDGSAWWVVK